MNIFKAIGLVNKIEKAIKKSKKIIDSKKDLAERVRGHLDNIIGDVQELIRLLPDFRNIYFEIIEIVEKMKQ